MNDFEQKKYAFIANKYNSTLYKQLINVNRIKIVVSFSKMQYTYKFYLIIEFNGNGCYIYFIKNCLNTFFFVIIFTLCNLISNIDF